MKSLLFTPKIGRVAKCDPSCEHLSQNPTTHYCGGDPAVISGNPLTWIDKGTTKSIYDPCPYGYRVPKDGSWAAFPKQYWTNGDIKGGGVWQSTWWPATGDRTNDGAALINLASYGHYWSSSFYSSPTDYRSYALGFGYTSTVSPSYNITRSYSFSLRCVQE